MTISCKDVTSVRSLSKIRLVAGQSGLDRVVRWVHFIDLPDALPWVQGGELLIITGIGLNGDLAKLQDIVRGGVQKKLAGLIINIGPYIEQIPEPVIKLANELGFPVFELPWEVKLVEVTQDICSYIVMKQTEEKSVSDLLEHILFSSLEAPEMLIQRAGFYGFDLNKPYQVAVIRAVNLSNLLQSKKLKDERALVNFKGRFEQTIREVLASSGKKFLSMLQMDAAILLLQQEKAPKALRLGDLLETVVGKLRAKLPGVEVAVGLGGMCDDLRSARQSYIQANRALQFADFKPTSHHVYVYEDLGIYKLLFEIESDKLLAYYREVLEPLRGYDVEHKMDLMPSLAVYFEENGNVVKASERLFIHRNTLDYRLKKIEEITGRRLSDYYDRLALQLAMVVGKRLAYEERADR
ncbi:MAG: PucR family transcriptional regulator ligand-binding domain-containing protein [Negativicutes bacterium]|nr:PucR family transcriptional regulator ligand-binding domain-containing protein [Negativicutes bacterium]